MPPVPKGFNAELQRTAEALAAGADLSNLDTQKGGCLGERQLYYGSNEMWVPVASIPNLVLSEMWHPFYVFQYFSVLVWIVGEAYYTYSTCIFVITAFSIISSAIETHHNMQRLSGIAYFKCDVKVLRGGEFRKVSSTDLVPGDVLVVQPGVLPCDAVLLSGECIVDENLLTGESVPVRKVRTIQGNYLACERSEQRWLCAGKRWACHPVA